MAVVVVVIITVGVVKCESNREFLSGDVEAGLDGVLELMEDLWIIILGCDDGGLVIEL